ncbi:hypothetical protein TNCV_855001 [Trichonephila clavipes]|nr:hypothetical protein TNCV_855001 [Trichonephila clavipes]
MGHSSLSPTHDQILSIDERSGERVGYAKSQTPFVLRRYANEAFISCTQEVPIPPRKVQNSYKGLEYKQLTNAIIGVSRNGYINHNNTRRTGTLLKRGLTTSPVSSFVIAPLSICSFMLQCQRKPQ